MGVDVTPKGWVEELRHAGGTIAPYLASFKDQKRAYVGRAYRSGFGKAQPDNHALELISVMRPRMLMGNPRCRWEAWSDDPDVKARALARTMACNAISRRTQMRNLLEALTVDWFFKWCVCFVSSEPQPGFEDVTDADYWPSARHIPPDRFRYDVAAITSSQRAWTAHLTIDTRKRLLKLARNPDSGWNADAISQIKNQSVTQFRGDNVTIPERDEIAYWTIYAPFEELDEKPDKPGYKGTVYTVVDNQAGYLDWIRKPYSFFGPKEGMHIMAGDLIVPGESTPMGPITSTAQQEEHLNRVSRATIRAIEKYKNVMVVRNGTNLAEITTLGKDLEVYGADGEFLRDAILPVSLGGATDQHFAAKQDARQSLNNASGITELMRGNIDPNNKATQEALASQASENKMVYPVGKFRDSVVGEIFRRWGVFLDLDENVGVDIPEQQALGAGLVNADGEPITRIEGGLSEGQSPEEVYQSDVSVEIGSMERDLDSDAHFRDMKVSEAIQEALIIGPIGSLFVDIEERMRLKAEMHGIPEIAKLVDANKMRALGMVQIAQGAESEQPSTPSGGGGPKPSYSRTKNAPGAGGAQLNKSNGLAAKASSAPQAKGGAAAAPKPKKPATAKAGA